MPSSALCGHAGSTVRFGFNQIGIVANNCIYIVADISYKHKIERTGCDICIVFFAILPTVSIMYTPKPGKAIK